MFHWIASVCALIVVLLLPTSTTWAEETGASYRVFEIVGQPSADGEALLPGMKIHENARLIVPPGSELTLFGSKLFGENGKIAISKDFSGQLAQFFSHQPTEGRAEPKPNFWFTILDAVLAFSGRGQEPEASTVDPWAIRIDTPGPKCLLAAHPVKLQVAHSLLGGRAVISDTILGRAETVDLASGIINWPKNLRLSGATEYDAIIDGTDKIVRWRILFVNGPDEPDERTLRTLLADGCAEQVWSFAKAAQPDLLISKP